jgi:hypothetical protein
MLFLLMSSHVHCTGMYQDARTQFHLPSRCHAPLSLSSFPYVTIFLPDCLSLCEQFLCSVAVLFGCSQKFSCRLGTTKSARGLSVCLSIHLSGVAFGSLPSQNHANVLLARLQNCEKLLLASSYLPVCLSVCPHGTARLPLKEFLIKFDI